MVKGKIIILGLGNDILSDDSIGPRLVNDLAHKFTGQNIILKTASCGGIEVMEYIRGYKKAIIIDAIRTSGGIPGTVYHFGPDKFTETSHLSNPHDTSFITALKIGKMLKLDIPKDLYIIAVEIVEDKVFSSELTLLMQKNYQRILKQVLKLVEQNL
jgi:hydrogenase maturation protease